MVVMAVILPCWVASTGRMRGCSAIHIPVTPSWPEQGIEFDAAVLRLARALPQPLAVGMNYCAGVLRRVSQRLRALGRPWPDLVALGFWLRPAALHAHLPAYASALTAGADTAPEFAVNVPTLGVFSWLMALLAGNSAIGTPRAVRIQCSNSCWPCAPIC